MSSPPPDFFAATAPPVVSLRGLVKNYGTVQALRGLDLTIPAGQVFGFLGRNGAGKSTTLRIIMGITLPTGGVVELFGHGVRGEHPTLRRRIGYVAQEQTFYGWMTPATLGRFVSGFYPTWDHAEFRRLLRVLSVPADQRIQTLSGGTQPKLALALALAHRPELLILDEPTAGMDAVARREFLDLVRAQAQGAERTTLLSSHLIDEVELAADTIGIVDDGRMLWQGPPRNLQGAVRSLRHRGPAAEAPPLPDLPISILEERVDGDGRTLMIRAADAAALEAFVAAASGWEIGTPSLEDVFVALVRRQTLS
jgi:ABC-type multidrug transport system ATPase subunit